jgi:hypothetical protein
MGIIFRLIGLSSVVFIFALGILTLITFRKEKRISSLSLLLSIALTVLMLPIFVFLSGARLNLLVALPVIALGLAVGFLWGLTTRLYHKNGAVMGKHSLLFLAGWFGSWMLGQLLSLFGSAFLASLGLLPLFFCTGTQVGTNTNLLFRRLLIKPVSAAMPPHLPETIRDTSSPKDLPK